MLNELEPGRPESLQPGREVPWGLGVAVAALLIAIAVAIMGTGITLSVAQALHQPDGRVVEIIAYQFLVLGIAISAVTLILLRYPVGGGVLGFRFPGWETLAKSATVVVPLLVGASLLAILFNALLPGFHVQGNARQELLISGHQHISLAEEILVLLWAAVEAPLAEETLFRGIVYQGLRRFFARWMAQRWAVLGGALLSGLAFGLVHGQPHTLPILIFMGVVLAYVFEYTRSVYASAIVHGLTNALAVVTLFQVT